jgi:hypothetical protein
MSFKVNTRLKNQLTARLIARKSTLSCTIALSLFAGSASAASMPEQQAQIQTLQTQINALAEQLESQSTNNSNLSALSSKTHIGGYGEMHYNNLTTTQPGLANTHKQEIDFHRFVLYFSHDFNEKIRFFSEFELEHSIAAGAPDGEAGEAGEIELEQAYIEMDLNPKLKTKAGIVLVPVGIMNETHEPETFYGTERNPVEKYIVPTTWWSGGAMLNGITDSGLSYDLMVSEGLYAEDGYTIRDGRQKTSKAQASDLAYTARIKYTGLPGLELAATARHETDLGQGVVTGSGAATLVEAHMVYSHKAFTVKALYAQWDIQGQAAKTANSDRQFGYYLEPSYKLNENWGVFGRYNEWNTTTLASESETQTDFGVNYWPHPNVVFKADYQLYKQDKTETNGFNLAVGYSF